jgi:signal peptidase II
MPSRAVRLAAVFLVLVATAGCDQATKQLARSQLNQFSSAAFPGGFLEFTLAENPGAFLSLGATLPDAARSSVLTLGVGLGLTVLLAYLVASSSLQWLSFLGLALAWAGGMSNLVDRFCRHGLVTDFILLRAGPLHTGVFNLADLAIVCGIILLLVSRQRRAGHKTQV